MRHVLWPHEAATGDALPVQQTSADCTKLHQGAYVQASKRLAARLGWTLDASGLAGEVDPEMCTARIQALFSRAQYYKQGKIAEKDSGKAFIPDWEGMARNEPVQAELVANMVCEFGSSMQSRTQLAVHNGDCHHILTHVL